MGQKEELVEIFKNVNEDVLNIVEPLIDDYVFIEGQLSELRKQPFIKANPKNPNIQKQTPAGKLYKELLAQKKDIVRILCSQLHKGADGVEKTPLDIYFEGLGKS